jgi:hypothetical protein
MVLVTKMDNIGTVLAWVGWREVRYLLTQDPTEVITDKEYQFILDQIVQLAGTIYDWEN